MEKLTFILGLLIVLVALYLIASPFLADNEPLPTAVVADSDNALEKQKESVFTTLNELEFDYRMKKITEEDYQSLKNQYKSRAVEVLKSEENLDALLGKKAIKIDADLAKRFDQEIEAEVAAIKGQN